MSKRLLLLLIVSGFFNLLQAQDSLQATILLIGDAGELTNGRHPVVEAARKLVKMDAKTTVLYLGDNLYKTGLPDNLVPNYEIAKAPLDSQIRIAGKGDAKVYFVPGNHDWANGSDAGYESILRVQSYIDILGNNNIAMLPRDGCPGPEEVKITDDVTLVMMDSQWWLQTNDKPGVESDCPYKTKQEVLTQLDEILSDNAGKLVLFAFHHPFRTYGPHGGYFTFKQHIFPLTDAKPNLYIPLPIIGSAYPLTRAVFGTAQDLKHPLYQDMMRQIEPIVKSHPNVIYLHGHEHTLQLIKDSGYNYIVSGSGCKSNRVSKTKNTEFSSSEKGFATLQISKSKKVQVTFYGVNGDSTQNLFSKEIVDFSKILEPEVKDTVREVEYVFKDSVVISASDKYKKENKFAQIFFGDNYRKVWSKPVSLQEFNISKEQGGFKILSLGGGKQTKSLKLADKNGKEWSLRTIEKDPEKALPVNLRGTMAQDVVEDMISASDPYAPLIVPTMAKAIGVPHADPKFFFVPDDPALGKYRSLFANKVAMLEERDPVPDNDTKSTSKVTNKLYEENNDKIDQEAVLKARLLDMLIGDFDRHADQWKWGTEDTGIGKLYIPVPRDRDQAFFNSDGLLVKYLSRQRMRFLQGFDPKITDLKGLNFVARDFDRFFLNGIEENTWRSITDSFVYKLNDQVIDEAVSKYPEEVKPMMAANIAKKLKSRRADLAKQSVDYYKFISREVTVTGSNEEEFFRLTQDGKNLKLSVYRKEIDNDSSLVAYHRSFDPAVTKEIRLFGLNGNDKFKIDSNVLSPIKVRIIGGKGEDSFNLQGNVRNYLYDLSTEKNVIVNSSKTRNEMSSDVNVLDYKSTGHQYNQLSFPMFNFGFNSEDGLLVGLGFHARTYGFRKEPYATDQKLTSLVAPANGRAYQLRYRGEFNQVLGKNDIILNADFVNPTLNNFFGIGNETQFNKDLKIPFYRVRYKFVETDLLLRRRYNDLLSISLGPTFYHYWDNYEDNKSRILGNPASQGLDSASIYSPKSYLGIKAKMDIVYIDNEVFPTRGITWFTEFRSVRGLNDNSGKLTKIQSDMTIYAKVSDISRVSTVLRFGGGHVFNDKMEYFQALNLGANNYLRGYFKNRFSGSSMLYSSAEMRYKIFKSKSAILPGDVGVLGFFDIGRVWAPYQSSQKWHNSYGGGLYFVPFNLIMLSATVAMSDESRLFNFTLGTKFNLTF